METPHRMLNDYFSEITGEMQRKSERIRQDFATHKLSAGTNREGIVGNFLGEYLQGAFGIGTGLVFASNGRFSDQADLVLVDRLSNAPLYPGSPESIWLVEAVLALFEVKTLLTPTTIADAVGKCAKFKALPRKFGDSFGRQKLAYSLFVLWAFEAPEHSTLKTNLVAAMHDIPLRLRPDFIVVPGHSVTRSGSYLRLSTVGSPGDLSAQEWDMSDRAEERVLAPNQMRMLNTGKDTLLAWLYWMQSWLNAAGPRRPELPAYVPSDHVWGTEV
jgi:hypothetical protein